MFKRASLRNAPFRLGVKVRKVKVLGETYVLIAPRCKYWKPGHNYLRSIGEVIARLKVRNGDILLISEKAICTANGNLVDENLVKPGLGAKIIAKYWMKWVWGYLLGPLCRLSKSTIDFLRKYPEFYGARHKQVALEESGLLAALCFGSEGGIDGSNLPYAYVSLPLREAGEAQRIREYIRDELGIDVGVVIVDSDRCYSWGVIYVSPRPTFVRGIKGGGGVIVYVVSNVLGLRGWPTPIDCSGVNMPLRELLELCRAAERVRGHGAGRSVWEMAERFDTTLVGVTWKMLESIPHYPLVVARKLKRKPANNRFRHEDSSCR